MAITTVDGYIAAAKQIIPYVKTAAVTSIATTRFTMFPSAGNPGAGTAAMTTAVTGVVPTDATAGYPAINAFGGAAVGYLTRVNYSNTVVGRLELWDILWGINVPTTPAAPTTITMAGAASYLGRCPSGHGDGCRIFLWITTAVAASAVTITVNYTNSAGTASRTTGASGALTSFTAGRWVELPLQAGDSGVDSVQSVVVGGTAAATGAVNVTIARPLWTNSIRVANALGVGVDGLDKTGMPIVYADSALMLTVVADSTSTGLPDLNIEIANG
jgi:hypothetical protein